MAKFFLMGGKKVVSAFFALSAGLLLITGCDNETPKDPEKNPVSSNENRLPSNGMPINNNGIQQQVAPDVPPPVGLGWSFIELMARTDPAEPENERYLDEWRFELVNIDDEARPLGPTYFGQSGPDGTALVGLPAIMFELPLEIVGYNEVGLQGFPGGLQNEEDDDEDYGDCRLYEIFVPAYCYDKAVWLLGPFEDSLWDYYKRAAKHRGETWNPSQVDCGTWLANMQLLILSDRVSDELNDLSDQDGNFRREYLIQALQENQQLLTPTRPPICMAERRHVGGGMDRGEIIHREGEDDDFNIDEDQWPWRDEVDSEDGSQRHDPVIIELHSAMIEDICETHPWDFAVLKVNGSTFETGHDRSYILADNDFMGTVHDQTDTVPGIDVTVYNTRLGNGQELDSDIWDDACAVTEIIQFTNTEDNEQDLLAFTGVEFHNLFGDAETRVWLTSDGDRTVDDNDYWAIFYTGDENCREKALAVEVIGHRQEDYRDVLHIFYNEDSEDLHVNLRADFELNEETIDGEYAFLAYTVSVWDGSNHDGRFAVRENIASCYLAADVWARQFFVTEEFNRRPDKANNCCIDCDCEILEVICPLRAAEFAVRSQCFSNSRANQRWRTQEAGYWSINTDHGVPGDIIVNAGWLGPHMNFEIYIQKFDEAVFKGPRTIRTSDDIGQLMVEMPTLVEGDRVLIKAQDNCCSDYDLVLPCVPEFTGFAGLPGIPYVPVTLGPPPVPPVPVPLP